MYENNAHLTTKNHINNNYNYNKIPNPNYNLTKAMKFSQLVRNQHRYGSTQLVTNTECVQSNVSCVPALRNKF